MQWLAIGGRRYSTSAEIQRYWLDSHKTRCQVSVARYQLPVARSLGSSGKQQVSQIQIGSDIYDLSISCDTNIGIKILAVIFN